MMRVVVMSNLTLLEQAHNCNVRPNQYRKVTNNEIDLAIACIMGEITLVQVTTVIRRDSTRQTSINWITTVLRIAAYDNRIKITRK